MIVLIARYHIKPGLRDQVEDALRLMVAQIKANEPSCPLFHVCRSQDDPNMLLLYEHYVDEQALHAHRETPHFKELVEGRIMPLLEKRERELYKLVIS